MLDLLSVPLNVVNITDCYVVGNEGADRVCVVNSLSGNSCTGNPNDLARCISVNRALLQ